jgi:biotin-dependent carboxylase-like uncharacterized protein
MLEVRTPGLQSTVQDAGRTEGMELGIPRSGACDPVALAAANLLLGNSPDAPALEMALLGPELVVRRTCVVAVAGADFEARVMDDGRRLRPGTSHLLHEGVRVAFGASRDGARAYLALAGGIDVPRVLGSASTSPEGRFGGLEGRPVQAGDVLRPVEPAALGAGGRSWPGPGPSSGVATHLGPRRIRIVEGPHVSRFPSDSLARLLETDWTVTPRSDREGVRLAGPPLLAVPGPEPVSLGMTWGTIEVPAGGNPIILLADHPTVGGYLVLAVAITADRPALGQLRAGDQLRFALVDLATARRLRHEERAQLREAESRLRMTEALA